MSLYTWLKRKGPAQGIVWILTATLIAGGGDVMLKYVGLTINAFEITFLKYGFAFLFLMPLMLHRRKDAFRTQNVRIYVYQSILSVAALSLFIYALDVMPVSNAVSLSFAEPMLFLPLAVVFLHEKVCFRKILATVIGFVGILIIAGAEFKSLHWVAIIPLGSALCYALQDLLTKTLTNQNEPVLTLIFYVTFFTCVMAGLISLYFFTIPSMADLLWLLVLGFITNMSFFCWVMAFRAADASFVAAFSYAEILFASLFGYFVFSSIPSANTFIGSGIVIASGVYMALNRHRLHPKR